MARMIQVFSSIVILLGTIFRAEGSGSMYDPPNRAVMWKYGFNMPKNYNYMQLNCGGDKQLENGPIKCGLCGDPDAGPRNHEGRGRYDRGVIGRYYPAGVQQMEIKVELLAFEKGFFEIRMCSADHHVVNQSCFDENILPIKEGYVTGTPLRYYPKEAGDYRLTVALPPNLTCNRCVVQWRYHTGNSWGVDPETKSEGIGLGLQEEFYNCADIRIGGVVPDSLHNNAFFSPELTQSHAGSVESPSIRQQSLTTGQVPVISDHVNLERVVTTRGSHSATPESTSTRTDTIGGQSAGRFSGNDFALDNFLAGFEAVKSWKSGLLPSTDSFTRSSVSNVASSTSNVVSSASNVASSASNTASSIAGFPIDQATHQPILATQGFGKTSADGMKSSNGFETIISIDRQVTMTTTHEGNRSPGFVDNAGQGSASFVPDSRRGSSGFVANSGRGSASFGANSGGDSASFGANSGRGSANFVADGNRGSSRIVADSSHSSKADIRHGLGDFETDLGHGSSSVRADTSRGTSGFKADPSRSSVDFTVDHSVGFTIDINQESTGPITDSNIGATHFISDSTHGSKGFKTDIRQGSDGFKMDMSQGSTGFKVNSGHGSTGFKVNSGHGSTGFNVNSGLGSTGFKADMSQSPAGFKADMNQSPAGFSTDLAHTSSGFVANPGHGSSGIVTHTDTISAGSMSVNKIHKDTSHLMHIDRSSHANKDIPINMHTDPSRLVHIEKSGSISSGHPQQLDRRLTNNQHGILSPKKDNFGITNTAQLHIPVHSMSPRPMTSRTESMIPVPSMADSSPSLMPLETGPKMADVSTRFSSVNVEVPNVSPQRTIARDSFVGFSQLASGDTTTSSLFDASHANSINTATSNLIDVSHKPFTDTKPSSNLFDVSHKSFTNVASHKPTVDTTTSSHFFDMSNKPINDPSATSQFDKQSSFGMSQTGVNSRTASVDIDPIGHTNKQGSVVIVHLGSAEQASTIDSSSKGHVGQQGGTVIIDMGGQSNTASIDVASNVLGQQSGAATTFGQVLDQQSGAATAFEQYQEPMLTDNTLAHSSLIDSSKSVNVQNQFPSSGVETHIMTKANAHPAVDGNVHTFMKGSMTNNAHVQSSGAQTLSIQQPFDGSIYPESQLVGHTQPSIKHVKQQASGFLPRRDSHTSLVTNANVKASMVLPPIVQASNSLDLDRTSLTVDQASGGLMGLSVDQASGDLTDLSVDQTSGGQMVTEVQFDRAPAVIDTRTVPKTEARVDHFLDKQQVNQINNKVEARVAEGASSSFKLDPISEGAISSVGMKRTDNMISTIIQNKAKDMPSAELGSAMNGFVHADFGITDVVPSLHQVSDTMHGMREHATAEGGQQILTEQVRSETGVTMTQDMAQHTFKGDNIVGVDAQSVGNTNPMTSGVQQTSTVTATNNMFDTRSRPRNVNLIDSIRQEQRLVNTMNVQQGAAFDVQQGAAFDVQLGSSQGSQQRAASGVHQGFVQQNDLSMPQQRGPDMVIDLRKVTHNMFLPPGSSSQPSGTRNIPRGATRTTLSSGDIQSQLDRFNFGSIPDGPEIGMPDQIGSGGFGHSGSNTRPRDPNRPGSGSGTFQDATVTMRQSGPRMESPNDRFIERRMVAGNFGVGRGSSLRSQVNFGSPSPPLPSPSLFPSPSPSRSDARFSPRMPMPQFTSRQFGQTDSERRPGPRIAQSFGGNTIPGFSVNSRFSPRDGMPARDPPRIQPGFATSSRIRPEPLRRQRFMERDQRMTGLGVAIESPPSMRGPFGRPIGGQEPPFRGSGPPAMIAGSFDGRPGAFRRRDAPPVSGPTFSGGFSRGAPSSFRRFSGGEVRIPPGGSDMFSGGPLTDFSNTMADMPFIPSFGPFPGRGTAGPVFSGPPIPGRGPIPGRLPGGRNIGGPGFDRSLGPGGVRGPGFAGPPIPGRGPITGRPPGGPGFGGPLTGGSVRGPVSFGPPGSVSRGGPAMFSGPPGLGFPGSGGPFPFSGFPPGGPMPFMF